MISLNETSESIVRRVSRSIRAGKCDPCPPNIEKFGLCLALSRRDKERAEVLITRLWHVPGSPNLPG